MMAYRGRLGLMHGAAGSGKTTFCSLAAAKISTGADWCDRPTIHGDVLIVSEDLYTWQDVAEGAGGDLSRIHTCRWRDLEARARALRPVAIVVDTMQFVAEQVGSPELDSASAVDHILRPLQALARELFCGVTVLDHEPWAEARTATRRSRGRDTPAQKVATGDLLMRCTATKDGFGGFIETITVKPSSGKGGRRNISASPVTVTVNGEITKAPTGGGGGGSDQFTVGEPVDPLDEKIVKYLMANSGAPLRRPYAGPSGGGVLTAWWPVSRPSARSGRTSSGGAPLTPRRRLQNRRFPIPNIGGVENREPGGRFRRFPSMGTGANRCGNRFPSYRGTASGNRFREPLMGTGCSGTNDRSRLDTLWRQQAER